MEATHRGTATVKSDLTTAEAAEFTSIGRTKAYELVWKGEWPSIRIGRILRVPSDGLREWVRQRSEEARGERVAEAGAGLSGWPSQVE